MRKCREAHQWFEGTLWPTNLWCFCMVGHNLVWEEEENRSVWQKLWLCAWYCGCSFTFWTVGLGYSLKNLLTWWRPQVSFGSMLIGWRKQWLKRSGKNAIATWYCRPQGTGRGWEGIVSSEGGAAAERPKESIISTQQYMSIFPTQFLELKVSPPCNDLFFWDLRCQKNTTKYCS